MKWHDFSEIIEDKTSGNPKLKVSEYKDKGEIPVIDQGKRQISGYSNDDTLKYNYYKPLIIFGDHTCILKYIDSPFILGADGVKALELKINADTKYIYYFLKTAKIPDTGYDRHFKYLKRIKIPLPPLETQKKIAAILDKANEIRKNDQKILEKYDQLAQSVFLEMFGDIRVNSLNWPTFFVGEKCIVTKLAGFEYTAHIKYKDEGEIIVIRGLNVKGGNIKLDNLKYIDKKTSDFLKRSKLSKGDVVMTYIGINIGDVALIRESEKYHLAPNVAKITPKDFQELDPYFLMNSLSINKIQFAKYTTNTAKQSLNMGNIRQIVLSLPPIDLQKKYYRISEKIETQKQFTQQSLQKSEELFQSLMQKAFKGELS